MSHIPWTNLERQPTRRRACGLIPALLLFPAAIASPAAVVSAAGPCTTTEHATIHAPDVRPEDLFGVAVALDGDVALVGAKSEPSVGPRSGAAYIFRYHHDRWKREARLIPRDAAAEDLFGQSVAVSGDRAVIGALWDDDLGSASGSAYVFHYDGQQWAEEQKLLPSDGAAVDEFGNAVAIDDDVIVVGSFLDDDHGGQSGSAYVFRHDGERWEQEQKLTAPDAAPTDRFGFSIDISGDVIVIGADLDDDLGMDCGSAYVFRYQNGAWAPEQKLLADDGAAADRFGAVVVDGTTIVVGARHADVEVGTDAGAAYVYRFDGSKWQQRQKLMPTDLAPLDWFGYSVAVEADLIAVGSWHFPVGRPGAAYVFRSEDDTWRELFRLKRQQPQADAHFGASVAIDGERALVGAPRGSVESVKAGLACFFDDLHITDCNGNCVDDARDIAEGTSRDANGNCVPDECEARGGE